MISIGVDLIAVERFAHFHTYNHESLQRIFSKEEIEYALSNSAKSAERFAVRFAAKEAFLKALCHLFSDHSIRLRTVLKCVWVRKSNTGIPQLLVEWQALHNCYPFLQDTTIASSVSLSHTKTDAIAIVLLQRL